jgi:hypothetical protein
MALITIAQVMRRFHVIPYCSILLSGTTGGRRTHKILAASSCLVPKMGVEPTRTRHWDLKPACLPFHHFGLRFLPQYVSVNAWQLGHNIRKFSSLLSSRIPFIWSNSRGIGSPSHAVRLHRSHTLSFTPSLKSRSFKLWVALYVEFSTSIWSRGIFFGRLLPVLFHP